MEEIGFDLIMIFGIFWYGLNGVWLVGWFLFDSILRCYIENLCWVVVCEVVSFGGVCGDDLDWIYLMWSVDCYFVVIVEGGWFDGISCVVFGRFGGVI